MKGLRRRVRFVAVALICAMAVAGCGGATSAPTPTPAAGTGQTATPTAQQPQPKRRDFVIAGSQATGTWFVFASAVCTQIVEAIPGSKCNPTPSSGSAENIRNLESKTIDLGMTLPDVLYEAYTGTGAFKDKKVASVRALTNTYSFPVHIIVLGDSPIKSLTDLKGKRIAIGPPGSTDHRSFEAIMAEYNIKMTDMNLRPLSLNDRVTALTDEQVDAIVVLTGVSSAAITELMSTKDARYLQVPPDVLKKINAKYPYFVDGVIPKGTYKNLREDVSTVFTWGILAVDASMDDETVYTITRTVFGKKSEIVKVIDLAKELELETAVKVPIPLHPGAERYFKEMGVLK